MSCENRSNYKENWDLKEYMYKVSVEHDQVRYEFFFEAPYEWSPAPISDIVHTSRVNYH